MTQPGIEAAVPAEASQRELRDGTLLDQIQELGRRGFFHWAHDACQELCGYPVAAAIVPYHEYGLLWGVSHEAFEYLRESWWDAFRKMAIENFSKWQERDREVTERIRAIELDLAEHEAFFRTISRLDKQEREAKQMARDHGKSSVEI